MKRRDLALWDRAYRIADIAIRAPEFRVGRTVYHPEGDPLAAHLMAEAIVNLARTTADATDSTRTTA